MHLASMTCGQRMAVLCALVTTLCVSDFACSPDSGSTVPFAKSAARASLALTVRVPRAAIPGRAGHAAALPLPITVRELKVEIGDPGAPDLVAPPPFPVETTTGKIQEIAISNIPPGLKRRVAYWALGLAGRQIDSGVYYLDFFPGALTSNDLDLGVPGGGGGGSSTVPELDVMVIGGSDTAPTAICDRIRGQSVADLSAHSTPLLVVPAGEYGLCELSPGRILLTGGKSSTGSVATAQLFDRATGVWTATGAMNRPRAGHSATRMGDGRVLVAGGTDPLGTVHDTAEIYDPGSGTFIPLTALMNKPRAGHFGVLLDSGRVLLIGGRDSATTSTLDAEVYDPVGGTFTSSINAMNTAHRDGFAVKLADGRVAMISGADDDSTVEPKIDTYNPATNVFDAAWNNLTIGRQFFGAALLQDGRVLVVGGETGAGSNLQTPTAEIYDPTTGMSALLPDTLFKKRSRFATVEFPDGTVGFAGGLFTDSPRSTLLDTELFEPTSGRFYPGQSVLSHPHLNPPSSQSAVVLNYVAGGPALPPLFPAPSAVTFGAEVQYAVNNSPTGIAVADFNQDGIDDLTVIEGIGPVDVETYLGTPSGVFTGPTGSGGGGSNQAIAAGLLTGDAFPDLIQSVLATPGQRLKTMVGTNSAVFTPSITSTSTRQAGAIAVADLNSDSKQDLVVANPLDSSVSTFLGDGSGSFVEQGNIAVGSAPSGVALADFDGDGKVDAAVTNRLSDSVTILVGDGTGSLAATGSHVVQSNPAGVATGDFDFDGRADLAVVNAGSDSVSILFGQGGGNFAVPVHLPAFTGPRGLAVGDVNGDGKLDLVMACTQNDNVAVHLGTGTGKFFLAHNFAANKPVEIRLGRFDSDLKPDLVTIPSTGADLSVMLQQ
ncbi:MAG: VCBS repeat-containing protein [Candidatus Riflebacteria bacterium]|nr:VCBS repeat-containing protein [Candidatus Riflebacteria bacterium]